MSSAGVIAHCLSPDISSNVWVYDGLYGDINASGSASIIWHEGLGRFVMTVGKLVYSSPDGRPPWRLDASSPITGQSAFGNQYSVAVNDNGRIMYRSGSRAIYTDNLRNYYSVILGGSPAQASATTRLVFTGARFVALGTDRLIHYSSDVHGTSWTYDPTSDFPLRSFLTATTIDIGGLEDRILAGTGTSGGDPALLVYSDDGALTWSISTITGTDPNPTISFDSILVDGTTIRAYKFSAGTMVVYTSTDSGVTYTGVNSSGSSLTTPTDVWNIYDGRTWGLGNITGTNVQEPLVHSTATGLRPFTNENVTEWPDDFNAEWAGIAHNPNISVAVGLTQDWVGDEQDQAWTAYKYRI